MAIIPASLHTHSDQIGIRLTGDALFRGLSSSARRTLAAITHTRDAAIGELIFSEGDVPSDLKILVEGHAVLVIGNSSADSACIRKAADGEIFGVTETLGRSPYQYSLKALTDCRIETISREDFENFLSKEKLPRSRLIRILGIAVQMRHLFVRTAN